MLLTLHKCHVYCYDFMSYFIYCWQNKTHGSRQISSQALWYHRVKNKVVTSHYNHIHHRFMVDEFPVNSNTRATNLYRHIFQTVAVACKMSLLCNDPPVRLLYSIFDLGYYVILISAIGNGTIEQHCLPPPPPPPPRLHHDSVTIWRICFICLTNITYEWTMCHLTLSGQ